MTPASTRKATPVTLTPTCPVNTAAALLALLLIGGIVHRITNPKEPS